MGPRTRYRVTFVTALILLGMVGLLAPAGLAQGGLQGFFAGTSADGGILLAYNHHDISASTLVHLAGVVVPGRALSSFNKYCSRVLGGNLLIIQVHQQEGRVGFISGVLAEITILAGQRRINFNKQVLVDGYGMLQREDRRFSAWEKYENTGRSRQVGIWSLGAPTWPIPEIPRAPAADASAGSDRERVFSKYGMPDHTNRVTVPDHYSFASYHLYITDFYMREGLVFIYRDGRLVNQQATGGR
jgi:hypothetical protein